MSAVALLQAKARPSRDEIVAALDGNICRCTNYANILAAVERAAEATVAPPNPAGGATP
jgi:aerobic-type carbon monoxide dehydrogenase small subunit (CoxS/CutS family)